MSRASQTLLLIVAATFITLDSEGPSLGQDSNSSGASQQLFIDKRRLPDEAEKPAPPAAQPDAAEEQRKAEEQKKLDDLAAKLKAEEEELAAREAEARKRFDELKQLSDQQDVKRKEDEDRLRAREAEAQKQVEEARQLADDARAKLQEQLQKQAAEKSAAEKAASEPVAPPADANPGDQNSSGASAPSAPPAAVNVPAIALNCPDATVNTSSLTGGRSKVAVQSPCRHGQDVSLKYGPVVIRRAFDDKGDVEFIADMFLGSDAETTLSFADGQQRRVALPAGDLKDVIKVAIVWSTPVNLDLHAFEYAAQPGEAGDVWSGAPRDASVAAVLIAKDGRGHGFMSSSDDGKEPGPKAEVFTFLQGKQQSRGAIAMALDYETRGSEPTGDACGDGPYAQFAIQVIVRDRSGALSRQNGLIASAPCGKTLSSEARYQTGIVPDIRIHDTR